MVNPTWIIHNPSYFFRKLKRELRWGEEIVNRKGIVAENNAVLV